MSEAPLTNFTNSRGLYSPRYLLLVFYTREVTGRLCNGYHVVYNNSYWFTEGLTQTDLSSGYRELLGWLPASGDIESLQDCLLDHPPVESQPEIPQTGKRKIRIISSEIQEEIKSLTYEQ